MVQKSTPGTLNMMRHLPNETAILDYLPAKRQTRHTIGRAKGCHNN